MGPAVVHCSAWCSSLRIASSGADMDPMCPSTDKAYTLKSTSRSTGLFGGLVDFSSPWRNPTM